MYLFTIKAGIFRDNHLRPDLEGCTEYLIYANTAQEAFTKIKEANGAAAGGACKNLGRKFIGIEMDANYFDIAKNRILEDG